MQKKWVTKWDQTRKNNDDDIGEFVQIENREYTRLKRKRDERIDSQVVKKLKELNSQRVSHFDSILFRRFLEQHMFLNFKIRLLQC